MLKNTKIKTPKKGSELIISNKETTDRLTAFPTPSA